LVGQLSNVLARQQDLIRAVGIRRLGSNGHTLCQYRFRHILFQRFLYESLDEVERVYLHQAVGQEMEQLYAGQADGVALHLARHFVVGCDDMRALTYFVTAGDVAAAAYANTEAAAHYRHAVEIVRGATVAGATLIDLFTRLGRVLELDSQFGEALAIYEELQQLARVRGDRTMELTALTAQSTLYGTLTPLHDPARGQALLEEALLLSRAVGDQAAEAKILGNLVTLHIYAGRAPQGIVYGEQALALARSLNLREQMALTLNNLGLSYYSIGHSQQAKAALHEARALWRELGNMPMLADSLSSACTVYLYAGEYEQAIAFSQEAYEISQAAGNLWGQSYSRAWVGYAYWQLGMPDAAIGMMEESLRFADLAGFAVPLAYTRADLALVLGALGAVERGLALVQDALAAAVRQVPLFRFHVLTRLAQLQLRQGNLAAAEDYIHQAKDDDLEKPPVFFYATLVTDAELALRRADYPRAMTILDGVLSAVRSFSVRIFLAQALYVQAQVYLKLGQKGAAQASLQAARVEAIATGSRTDLWPILMSLSQLETDLAEAERLRRQAQAIVESIAAHVSTPDLRASFLSLPEVQAVFDPVTKQGRRGV
jgi:tetratricopeptide (TPR) repeat protein